MADNNKTKFTLPLLITKAYTLFPGTHDEKIDAGRDFSIKAIQASRDKESSLLVVVSQKDQKVETPTIKDLYRVGTLCRITTYTDMKTYVSVRINSSVRVKLNNISFDQSGYYVADVEVVEDIPGDNQKVLSLLKDITSMLPKVQRVAGAIPRSVYTSLSSQGMNPGELADALAPYLFLNELGRQKILEAINVEERLTLVAQSLKESLVEAKVDADMSREVSQQTEKQQKDYILREKMKAIKKELGEDPESANDEDNILKRLEENPYPEHVKTKVKQELKRYQMMPQASLESSLIMSYIQTLMDVPWYQETEDNNDLKNASDTLMIVDNSLISLNPGFLRPVSI